MMFTKKGDDKKVVFDPFGWAQSRLGQKNLHIVIRVVMSLLCLYLLVARGMEYHLFRFKPLWFVETLIFAVLALAYFIRVEPVDRAVGFKRILLPIFGGLLPFALLHSDPNPIIWKNDRALMAVFISMCGTTALTVWGMWALRGAFSITVEARRIISGGPYRFVRHPIYLGEVLTALAVTVWRLSLFSLAVFLLFVTVQLVRSKWEEETLSHNFPEYREKMRGSFWFWR